MPNTANIRLVGETNRGLVRTRNEDNFFLAAYDGDNAAMAIIADGIGGQRDGDIASFFCCHELFIAWQERSRGDLTAEAAVDFLLKEIHLINKLLHDYNRRERYAQNMGTTIAAAIFLPDRVVTAHAGDSRIYRFDGEDLIQLTEDHTLINKLHADGRTVADPTHDLSHIISRAVGPRSHLELDINMFDRAPADRYLLCSDGMSRYIDDHKLKAAIAKTKQPHEVINELMRLALIAGGADNITIICGFPTAAAEEKSKQADHRGERETTTAADRKR